MVSPERKINLVMVCGLRLFRDSLKAVLDKHERISLSLCFPSLRKLVDKPRPPEADVFLIEDGRLGVDKVHGLKTLQETYPGAKILVISSTNDQERLIDYIDAGACGYLTTDSNLSDLCKAIAVIENGQYWIERKIAVRLIKKRRARNASQDPAGLDCDRGLSRREKEVLAELKKGFTNKQIADTLFISEKTVKCHLRNIFKKLNVSRRFEAVICAMQKGIS